MRAAALVALATAVACSGADHDPAATTLPLPSGSPPSASESTQEHEPAIAIDTGTSRRVAHPITIVISDAIPPTVDVASCSRPPPAPADFALVVGRASPAGTTAEFSVSGDVLELSTYSHTAEPVGPDGQMRWSLESRVRLPQRTLRRVACVIDAFGFWEQGTTGDADCSYPPDIPSGTRFLEVRADGQDRTLPVAWPGCPGGSGQIGALVEALADALGPNSLTETFPLPALIRDVRRSPTCFPTHHDGGAFTFEISILRGHRVAAVEASGEGSDSIRNCVADRIRRGTWLANWPLLASGLTLEGGSVGVYLSLQPTGD